MSVRRHLSLVSAAYLLVTVVGGLLALSAARQWSRDIDARRDWLITQERLTLLRVTYSDQETGQRGYVLTGDAAFRAPYDHGLAQAAGVVTLLRSVAAPTDVVADLDAVVAAADAWRTQAAEPAIAARQVGVTATDQAATTAVGKQLFDTLRARLDTMASHVQVHVDAANGRVDTGRRRTFAAFVTMVVASLGVTVVNMVGVRRWITLPLSKLTDAVRQIRAGERTTIEPSGPSELREVGTAVDEMQRTIAEQRDDAVRAREAVEQSTALAVQVRSQLTSDLGEYPQGWTMAAGLRPAEGIVAGDCYDVGLLSPTTVGIAVLDIAGHGAEAAVAALKCKELLKAALRSGLEPGRALDWLFAQDHGLDSRFLTAFVIVIDTVSGRCRFANAGHPPALLISQHTLERLGPTGPILGPFPATWGTRDAVVPPGAKLLIHTDGLTEARDERRTFYGEERLARLLSGLDCAEAQALIDETMADLDRFHPGRLVDDVTVVVGCRAADGVEPGPRPGVFQEVTDVGTSSVGDTTPAAAPASMLHRTMT